MLAQRVATTETDARRLLRRAALRLILTAPLLLPPALSGCRWNFLGDEAAVEPITQGLSQHALIEHLNANSRQLHAWKCTNAKIAVRPPGMPITLNLSAYVAVERDQNFRLRAALFNSDEADFGSNAERFWFWIRRSEPSYVFTARHEELPEVARRLPVPFQPAWLMEALGVREIDPAKITVQQPGPEANTVNFVFEDVSPSGERIRRELLVDSRLGVILGHTLYDGNGRLIARATLSNHRREPSGVVMPHRVRLEFPQSDLAMTMDLGEIEVNPSDLPQQVWALPEDIPNSPVFDMGRRLALPAGRAPELTGSTLTGQMRQVAEAPPFADLAPAPTAPVPSSPPRPRIEPTGWRPRSVTADAPSQPKGRLRPAPEHIRLEAPPFTAPPFTAPTF
jgi:hypothetical protein